MSVWYRYFMSEMSHRDTYHIVYGFRHVCFIQNILTGHWCEAVPALYNFYVL